MLLVTDTASPRVSFAQRLAQGEGPLTMTRLDTLQVNLGKLCNQACKHCHVDASPTRTEIMTRETVDQMLAFAEAAQVKIVDLTGGAPEMNPHFRDVVTACRKAGRKVIDRCNLTILSEPGYEGTAEFLAEQEVEVVASLPCYTEENVDGQRGNGVFLRSIEALKKLNLLGYGKEGGELVLNLVYNPGGPFLPPDQGPLEVDYKRELQERFGIVFNHLFTITNMPIHRFEEDLQRKGLLADYWTTLEEAFNPAAVAGVMCTNQISVGWDGFLYDCDFNQMLEMKIDGKGGPLHLSTVRLEYLLGREIQVDNHCYGCTAGAGSSCGGALA
jgi:radical SAM/Cys-rich protein